MDFSKPHPLLAAPGKKFFPVIHMQNEVQVIMNTDVALENGADGVFIINHNNLPADVLFVYEYVRAKRPDVFIGVNFLGWNAAQAFEAARHYDDMSALWVDDAGIGEHGSNQAAMKLLLNMMQSNWPGAYFASTAFKYQKEIKNVAAAAINAIPHCHAVVTSGTATGSAPDIKKLQIMHDALAGRKPLANASGTTIDNVESFAPFAETFIVATSINQDDDFYNLHPARVRAMANILHAM